MKKLFSISILFILNWQVSFAQVSMINNGAKLVITSGAYVTLDGNYENKTSTTDGAIDIDGFMKLSGNFTNNAAGGYAFINVDTDGEVIFNKSGTQIISGTGNFIKIESTSTTEMPAGKAATVNGDLKVDGVFILRSPSNNGSTASLITKSTTNTGAGNSKAERYITSNNWHYFSSPVTAQSKTIFSNSALLYYWDDSADEWWDGNDFKNNAGTKITSNIGWKNMPAGNFTPGKGYICFELSSAKKTFEGDFTTGDINFTLQYFAKAAGAFHTSAYDGWNLIGNPYPSAIDWLSVSIDKSAIDNAIYFYDDDSDHQYNNYRYYVNGGGVSYYPSISVNQGSQYIPAMQAFFVKAKSTSNGSVFTIPNDARIHNTASFYKSGSDETFEKDIKNIMIRLNVEMNSYKDESVLRFIPESTDDYDGEFDAYKRFSTASKVPQVYFPTSNSKLAVSTISKLYDLLQVPVTIRPGGEGICTVSADDINLEEGYEVFLLDRKKNKRIALREDNYTFLSDGTTLENRFFLIFKSPTDLQETINIEPEEILSENEIIKDEILIFASQKNIFIQADNSFSNHIEICNSIGAKVLENSFNSDVLKLETKLTSGIYFVKLKTDNAYKTQKIYIE